MLRHNGELEVEERDAPEMDWRKVRRDLLWASSYQVTAKLVGYLILVLLIRHLDKGRMGEFFFAATLATFVAVFLELGVRNELIRSTASRPDKGLELLSRVLSIQLPLIGVAFLLIAAFATAFKQDIATTLLLTAVYVLLQEVYSTFGAFFLGLRQVVYRVITAVGAQLVLAAAVLAAVALNGDLVAILWCYIGANALLVASAILIVVFKFGRLRLVWDVVAARGILRAAFPLFVLTFLGLAQFKVDTLMLGFMRSYQSVAAYESAYKLLEASRAFVRPGVMIFFPLCAGLAARREWGALSFLARRLILVAFGLAVVLTIAALASADVVVPFLFGDAYADSAPVLRVLFLSAPALFLGLAATFLATALHLEKPATKILLVSLAINIVLNALFIPRWGALGAAWTTLVSESILAVGLVPLVLTSLRARAVVAEPNAVPSTVQEAVRSIEREPNDETP